MNVDWSDESVHRAYDEMVQRSREWQTAEQQHGAYLTANTFIKGRPLELNDLEEWEEHYQALIAAQEAYYNSRLRFLEAAGAPR